MLTATAYQNGSSGHLIRPSSANRPAGSLSRPWRFDRADRGANLVCPECRDLREKEPADCLYKVLSGTVRSCRALIDGRRQIGAFYLPGDMFGLESGEEHVFSAEAVADAKVLVINRSIAGLACCAGQ